MRIADNKEGEIDVKAIDFDLKFNVLGTLGRREERGMYAGTLPVCDDVLLEVCFPSLGE